MLLCKQNAGQWSDEEAFKQQCYILANHWNQCCGNGSSSNSHNKSWKINFTQAHQDFCPLNVWQPNCLCGVHKIMFCKTRLYLWRFPKYSRNNWYEDLCTKHKWMLSDQQLSHVGPLPPLPSRMWPTEDSPMCHKCVVRPPTWDSDFGANWLSVFISVALTHWTYYYH